MKNGVLVYQTNPDNQILNIGDYIQSLAAMQFFVVENSVYVNRERLDEYSGDKIKLVMNGWFMHSPNNWPPSPSIYPLFVAFHMNKLTKDQLLSNETSLAYFRLHQPIGCRDFYTVNLLKEKGIQAYFSGCMTLTLGLTYKTNNRDGKIYFVDPPVLSKISLKVLFKSLCLLCFHSRSVKNIFKKRYRNKCTISNYIRNLLFIEKYSRLFQLDILNDAEYIEHEIYDRFNSEQEKFAYASELLGRYSRAKLVVTSRIHCALPCLSMETPVLFVYDREQDEISKCRMDGLIQLFNIIEIDRESIRSTLGINKIDYNTFIENKVLYKKYKEELIDRCVKFFNNA